MAKNQQAVLALAMLGIVVMLLWVPYTATYKWEDSSWTTASAGYDWVFSEPNSRVCQFSIEQHLRVDFKANRFDVTSCHIALDSRRLAMTLIAAVIGVAAILMLLGISGRRGRMPSQEDEGKTLTELSGQSVRSSNLSELARELLRTNPLLPIGSGDMSESMPLVITVKKDYVPIEYVIMEITHKQLNYLDAELETQGLIAKNGRSIDALTYKYKEKGSTSWTERKTYYFDITAGMNEFRRKFEKNWWEFWK